MRIKEIDQKELTIVLACFVQNMDMWQKMAERVKDMPDPVRQSMETMKQKGQNLLNKYGKKEYLEEYKRFNEWKKDLI